MNNTDALFNALEAALNICGAIRRDFVWTGRGADNARRHALILADFENNFIPLAAGPVVTILRGAINGEREAFATIR